MRLQQIRWLVRPFVRARLQQDKLASPRPFRERVSRVAGQVRVSSPRPFGRSPPDLPTPSRSTSARLGFPAFSRTPLLLCPYTLGSVAHGCFHLTQLPTFAPGNKSPTRSFQLGAVVETLSPVPCGCAKVSTPIARPLSPLSVISELSRWHVPEASSHPHPALAGRPLPGRERAHCPTLALPLRHGRV